MIFTIIQIIGVLVAIMVIRDFKRDIKIQDEKEKHRLDDCLISSENTDNE